MNSSIEPASDILTITIDPSVDPDGSHLRQLLERELDYEHARAAWLRWAWILAVATCVRWLVWPQLAWVLPVVLRGVAMPVWLAVSARAATAGVVVWYRSRRWDAALARHPAATVQSPSR